MLRILLDLGGVGIAASHAVEFEFVYSEELSQLPSEVASQTPLAHGGFALDAKTGEVFFGLKGAGIIKTNI